MKTKLKMKTKLFVNDVEASEMFDYVVSFYGSNGVYSNFFETEPITDYVVDMAIAFHKYVICPTLWNHNGYGDSFDRELVRDIMRIRKGLCKTNEVEYSHIMTKFFTPTGLIKVKYKYWMELVPKDIDMSYTLSYLLTREIV